MSVWPRYAVFALLLTNLGALVCAQDQQPVEKPKPPAQAPETAKDGDKSKPVEKTEEQKKAEEKAAEELKQGIGNVLKQLFPGAPRPVPRPRAVRPGIPNVLPNVPNNGNAGLEGDAEAGPKRALDAIDKLAPVDPQLHEDWQKVLRRSRTGDWQAVIAAIDKMFEQGRDDTMTLRDDGSLVSVRREAMRLIAKAPAEVREAWERANLAAAVKKLDDARASDDSMPLTNVASRYFGLAPGFEAADLLATRHMDRGEHGVAVDWISELWNAKAPLTRDRAWQRKALVAARVAGDLKLANQIEAIFRGGEGENSIASRATRMGSSDEELQRIARIAPHQVVLPDVVEDWPMLFGNSRRLAVAKGSDPTALQRWQLPTTGSMVLQKRIDALTDFMTERGTPSVPTVMPLLVNGRIVFRSIEGIEVVDAETGRVVWSLHDSLQADSPWNTRAGFGVPSFDSQLHFNANDQTGGPLGQLLFTNSARAVLSSDGVRLFVVEDDPFASLQATSGRMWNFRGNVNGTASRLGTNVLRALDLETGRTLWQVGGPDLNEDVTLPLAGNFLLGAPVVDAGELFVVGQKQNEIRLFVLDAASGQLKWSQLLAFSELPIERDLQRRIWSIQVAVSGSIVVCPTTVGWMVGVDRTRRSILWAQRYSKSGTVPVNPNQPNRVFFGGNQAVAMSNEPMASRWAVSAPVISGGRVIFTAIENKGASDPTGVIVSVDLYSGRKHWEQTRGTMHYLAGVLSDRLILVGLDSLKALSLDGKPLWSQKLPAEHGRISGRGVIVGDQLYQPTQRGALLKFNLPDGKLVSSTKITLGRRSLGNLAMYRGLMLSLHAGEVTAFEQQDSVTARLADVAQKSDRTLEDRLFAARLAIADGQHENALAALRPVPGEFPNQDAQRRYESLLRDALTRQLNQMPEPSVELKDELRRLSRTSAQHLQVIDLDVRQESAAKRDAAAMRGVLAELRRLPTMELEGPTESNVVLTPRAWARGKLTELWPRVSPADRATLLPDFQTLVQEALREPLSSDALWIAECVRFHPSVLPLAEKLAEHAETERRLTDAESWLDAIAQHAENASARNAVTLRKARGRLAHQDYATTATLLDQLSHESPATTLSTGETLDVALAKLRNDLATASKQPPAVSSIEHVTLERYQSNYTAQILKSIEPTRREPSYFQQVRIVSMHEHNGQSAERLIFSDAASGKLLWNVPLRTKSGHVAAPQIRVVSSVLYVLNGGALHALSVPDRRVLWTSPVESAENLFTGVEDFGFDSVPEDGDHQRPESVIPSAVFLKRMTAQSRLPVTPVTLIANDDYLAYRVRDRLSVFDARTGTLRWRLERLSSKAVVTGTESLLFVIDRTGGEAKTYQPINGALVETPEFARSLVMTLLTRGNVAVTIQKSGEGTFKVAALQTRTGKTEWEVEFPDAARIGRLAEDELLIFHPTSKVTVLSLWNGETVDTQPLAPELRVGRTHQFAFRDRERFYVLLNGQGQQWIYGESNILPANGSLVAFDRQTGKQVWTTGLSNFNLLLSDVNASPLLIGLQRQQGVNFNGFGNEFTLLAIEKSSGKRVLEQSESLNDTNFRSVLWQSDTQHVDLQTYNQRLRLKAAPKPAGK